MSAVKDGLDSNVLKMIAVVTMLIDHVGATVLGRMLSARGMIPVMESADQYVIQAWFSTGDNYRLYIIYRVMRHIGRIAFPIFCFMLVEGLEHTRDVRKYALRLGIFALISEIPFDLAFSGTVLEFKDQNIFFTLLIGLVTIAVLDRIEKRQKKEGNAGNVTMNMLLAMAVTAAGIGLAFLLHTDYDGRGVVCILIMYYARRTKWKELVAGYAAFVLLLGEITAFPAFLFLACYRGKRGAGMKYFFYGFYPVHLFILYLTCIVLGIAAYPAL